MTSPKVRYILIGEGDGLSSQVDKLLPAEIKKEFSIDVPANLENENNYKVRFVFFDGITNSVLTSFENMPDEDVTALEVSKISDDYGKLNFYKKSASSSSWEVEGSESYYIGLNSLIGAIYTDELETYECNMQNVFSRLKLVTEVYIIRTTKLLGDENINFDCINGYNNVKDLLNNIETFSQKFDQFSISEILGAMLVLSQINEDLQLKSCSLVY